jgi:predicted ATPase
MRISKLSLTNFRSFKQTQTIEFAPLTLLFGPNSVGKSTVLMSLFYLQQLLTKKITSPNQISAIKGKYIDGFFALVNEKDLSKDITVAIELDKQEGIGKEYLTETTQMVESLINKGKISDDDPLFLLSSIQETVEKFELEFVVSWSQLKQEAYLKSYTVKGDGELLGQISTDEKLEVTSITKLNLRHAALQPLEQQYYIETLQSEFELVSPFLLEKLDNFEIEDERKSDNGYLSALHYYLMTKSGATSFSMEGWANTCGFIDPITIVEQAKLGVPALNQKLNIVLNDPEVGVNGDYYHKEQVVASLSELFISPLDMLSELLGDSVNIGPLRVIPDQNFNLYSHTEQKHWYDGRAAWDLLAQNDNSLNEKVNAWLQDEDKLNTGVGLLKESEPLRTALEQTSIQQNYHSKASTPFLWDCNAKIPVWPSEVGVGISQLMPLIVASHHVGNGIISIEQPELHIHPRLQVQLGDLLTQVDTQANFLIETHSEHLVLRLLRRIRETTDSELPSNLKAVQPEDVAIIYLSPSEDGVTASRIGIDEDGEFEVKWPNGFFAERRGELF